MINRRLHLIVCLLVIVSMVLGGCALPFRRPEPERMPERTPTPQPAAPPRPQAPDQRPPRAMDTAERLADLAANVQGVEAAAVVVVSNLALVGITLDRGEADARGANEIKQQVANRIEQEEPSIVNAYVSANPDIIKQIQDINQGIARGEPISTFFDQITDTLERMRAEKSN